MEKAFAVYRGRGIDSVVFGDLFPEDVRAYRDQFLARHNMRGIYPVWLRDTTEFIREFINLGFKAVITCVDGKVLDQSFAGAMINEAVRFSIGEKVERDSFWFCDQLPE